MHMPGRAADPQSMDPARPGAPHRPIEAAVLALLAPTSPDWHALYDVEGPAAYRHHWVDRRAGTVLGLDPERMVGKLVADTFPAAVADRFHASANRAIAERRSVRYETDNPAGTSNHTIEVTLTPVFDGDECRQMLITTRDVSERVDLEAERASSERRLRKLMENAPDIVWLIDIEGTITYATSATQRLLGYAPEELVGRSSFVLLPPEDVPAMQEFFGRLLSTPGGTPLQSELRTVHRDGSVLWTEATVTNMLDDPDIGAIVVNAHDVTERKKVLAQLEHHALHDSLTGLPNRLLVTERLNAMLANATGDRLAAAFFVDFDGFKLINDTLGHEVGDLVIREAARRLVDAIGTRGCVARFGGDEFVVAASKLGEVEQHLALAHEIRDAIAVPYDVDTTPLYLTASVGLATGSSDSGLDADMLIRNADMAMYEAKRMKLPGPRLFDESLRIGAERRLQTMNSLRRALDEHELVLHYQPVFDLPTRVPVGVEALVRWNHPTKGLVPPADFIPVAEETGLIVPMGEWILDSVCAQLATWAAAGTGRYHASVNVSRKQLVDPSFLRKLRAAVSRSGIAPSMLTVEITENLIMEDPDTARTVLEEVAELGITVSIDDFGRGYSSLAFLSQFPAHQLKIDRMFVEQLGREDAVRRPRAQRRPGATLVNAIVDMAHALGLEVVAEGVETEQQLAALRALGCEFAQGYLLGRPQPAEAVAEVLGRPGEARPTTSPTTRRRAGATPATTPGVPARG